MARAMVPKLLIFGLVGVGASVVHVAVAWAAMHALASPALGANLMGFGAAFIWSYLGHYHLTFRTKTGHVAAFGKFAAVALAGFAINSAVVLAWQWVFGTASIWAIVLGVGLAAGAVFLASNFWAFKGGTP